MGPLDGIRILDLTSIVMGPFATQILGDMGADVIKIEAPSVGNAAGNAPAAPGGDTLRYTSAGRNHGMSNLFINCNRNKRSVVLDLKSAEGRGAFLSLAATADALIYNVRPQAMRRLKLGYDEVRAVRPDIVYVGGFGFGESGPYAGQAAFDDLIQAMIGVPDMVPINFCDRVCGLALVNTVLGALLHRARTGEGQSVEVPMYETLAQFVLGDHLGGHSFVPPIAPPGYLRLLNPVRKPFATKDGYLCVLAYNDRQWQSLFNAIGKPELIRDPLFANVTARSNNFLQIGQWLEQEIAQRTTAEWLGMLASADIPNARVRSLEELIADEHLHAVAPTSIRPKGQ
jgi:crotonobetainyl-CoA:carnitine CoA-transferase CaiB-like acyl-CoA transferase